MFSEVNPGYLLCLFTFGVAVIIYTTYGGFHAVVWTDVMQGVVMVVGVLIMLPLALYQVGKLAPPGSSGLEYTTREMAKMTPPEKGTATLRLTEARGEDLVLRSDTWIPFDGESGEQRLLRLTNTVVFPSGQTETPNVDVLELTARGDIERKMAMLTPTEVVAGLSVENVVTEPYAYGAKPDQAGAYVSGPGPHADDMNGFLPASLAISFFFMWAISGSGQPSNMVRL